LKSNFILAATFAAALFVGTTAYSEAQTQSGIASVYTMTAAHRSLPFGTKVKVTNKRNGRSVVVTITDRGPFIRGRVIDLTMAGANAIGMGYGIAPVTLNRL
jgi:rare lipoprotein A